MTVARSVADVLSEHVVVQVDCIDRMYCNVYVPGLQYPEGPYCLMSRCPRGLIRCLI